MVIRRGPQYGEHIDRYRPFGPPPTDTEHDYARCGACSQWAILTSNGRLREHHDSRGYDCPNRTGPGEPYNAEPDRIAAGLAILDAQADALLEEYRRLGPPRDDKERRR